MLQVSGVMATKRKACCSTRASNENLDPDLVDFQSPKKRRFANPVSEEQMSSYAKGVINDNTDKSTKWAVNAFTAWVRERNKSCTTYSAEKCPEDLLTNKPTAEKLNLWLCRFMLEVRKGDGTPYPAKSLYQILKSQWKECPNFVDKGNVAFTELHATCDKLAVELRQAGIGAKIKHAAVVTPAEEDQLWDSGSIGIFSPKVLLRCVFYYVGKCFCLRGGQELRELKPSQFVRGYNPDSYTYVENGSKNHKGTFGNSKESNKVVTILATEANQPPKCVVYLLDCYFRRLPKPPENMEFFFAKPLEKLPSDTRAPWFHSVPIGKNTLGGLLAEICKEAGIEKKTNHSLRATGATAMFAAGVPEKMIKEVTGHKSSKALEIYERPTVPQKQALANVLNGSCRSNFGAEVTKMQGGEKKVTKTSTTQQYGGAPFMGSLFQGLTDYWP